MKRTPLTRKTPMKRSRPEFKSPHKRTPEQGGDEEYLRWIRKLPCCVTGCAATGSSHAHHSTGAGMALKAHDRETMPLCATHHRQFHDGRGYFLDWGRAQRRSWQAAQVGVYQASFLSKQLKNAR